MGPKIVIFYSHFMMISLGVLAQAPDIGRIFIGTQGNRSDPTEYTINNNYNPNTDTLSIPFTATVFSGTDGTEVGKDDLIEVTCVNEFASQSGYTQLRFDIVNLPPADSEGRVNFDVTGEGRAAAVRCYGRSINGAFQCPATTNQAIPQPEFCRETSISDPVSVTLTPSPVVSICEPVNRVPSFTTATYSGTFQVTLSEAVRSGNVTVTCGQVSPSSLAYCQQADVTCCQATGSISITSTLVTEGQTTATMSYQITRQNSANICVGVQCQAGSVAELPEGYFQYLTSSSSDSSSQGLFQALTPDVRMQPQYLTVYNTSFQSLLYLDASVDTPFQCQALVASTLEEALQRLIPANIDCTFIFANATTTPRATTTPAPTTTHPSSPWITVDNSFTITADSKFYVVRTSRELLVIAPVQEVVVTTCCSTVTDPNSVSRDLRVAAVTVADLVPRMNNTGGVTSGEADEERFVVNPAYREVAPCPCDLTYLTCDINCCCDTECTDAEKETFADCIAGRPGGLDPGPDLRSCKSDHFPKDDWFPLMCVEFESNALLGQFYKGAEKLTSVTAVNKKLVEEQKSNVYTYRETEPRFSDLAVVNGYTEGSNVLTINQQGGAGNLPLPQQTNSGYCLDSTPVKFLRNFQSTCTRTLTPATCADLTPFSARVYLEASSLFNPACPRSFAVSSTGRSLQDESQRVDVRVNYLCANDSAAYVKDTVTGFSDLVPPQTVSSFPPGLQNVNCTGACDADSACLSYNAGKGDADSGTLPTRCVGDTSFVLPLVPTYVASTGICENVVLDVSYRFSWAGQALTGLTADVILGDVRLTGNEAGVSQKFAAAFSHEYSGASNQSDNYQGLTTPYQRSGKPGYDFGQPVASGCRPTNTSGGSSVNVGEVNHMAVWSPGVDGLCGNAKRRSLTFGDDLHSSCVLRLAFNDINSCDSLKKLVSNHLEVLMPANVIGRYGYNDPDNSAMWIGVLREDPFPITDPGPTTPASPTANVTVATTAPPTPENVTFDPLSVRGGVCRNVVSGVHLEILYAETARNFGYPLLEVVGAAVRYSVSNWSMSCVGPSSGRCEANSPYTQPFLVTSSVQYTKVSPTAPHKPILFYQIHDKDKCDTDTCNRFYEDFDTSICHYDTCWHELFYPIVQGYPGYDGVNYTRGFSLVFLVFILGYLSVVKPWK